MAISYNVIDADGHVLEPPDLWERYMDPKYRDGCPALLTSDDGEVFRVDGDHVIDLGRRIDRKRGQTFGGLGAFGAREVRTKTGRKPYAAGTRGGFDPHARIADMDAEGIDAAFLYPSLGVFLGEIKDGEKCAAACRAYNRWLAEYCAPYPERLFGVALLPLQSAELAVREMRFAVKELGFRAVDVYPNVCDGRVLHRPELDPLWAQAQEMNIAVGVHGAQVLSVPLGLDRFTQGRAVQHFVGHTFEMMAGATSMIMCGVCDRFPSMRVAFLEAGGGWMAGLLDRMDRHFDDATMNDTGLKTRPSEIFRRQCFISFEPVEKALVPLASYLGPKNILWATDYPHGDGFPNAPRMLRNLGLEPQTLADILATGAKRFYNLD